MRTCESLDCSFGSVCQTTSDGFATCECPMCGDAEELPGEQVCGTDRQTYGSECQLRTFACRQQTDIQVAYDGPCQSKI